MNEKSNAHSAMDEELGEALPRALTEYAAVDEELFNAYLAWRSSILDDGLIPRSQKLLMVVALLTAQRDGGPLRLYAEIARSQGVSAAELKEALRVGILFSGGAGVDTAAGVVDLLREPDVNS